ncbi:MAG: hypothetical protein ABL902_00365 [Gallionella sp.]
MNDEYTVKEIIEPQSGKVHRLYSYKRKPCKRVLLSSKLTAQLAGYSLIEKDLRNVLAWLNEIDKLHTEKSTRKGDHFAKSTNRETYNLVKGLFVASLTFYGKCFSKCEGRPVKLERLQLEEKFHDLHDNCIAYRHNFAAHSGAKRLEYADIALILPLKSKHPVLPKLYTELYQPDLMYPSAGEIKFNELLEHARSIAKAKIELLSNKILKEEVAPKGLEYWLKK